MLMGEFHNNLDLKNRVVVPSKLRDELGREFILTRGLDGSLFGYSLETWKKLTEKLNTLSFTQKESRNFTRFLMASATTLEFDKQGRIVIPNFLKTHAALEKEVVIVGVLDRIEIWSVEKWNTFMDENFESLSDISSDLFSSN